MVRKPAVLFSALLLCAAAAPLLPGLGPASRRVLVHAGDMPWRAVAMMQAPGEVRCSAALVAPRTALTAAHCVWSRRMNRFMPASALHVLAGYEGGGFAAHTFVTAYRVAPDYDPSRPGMSVGHDVAVLTLASPLGNATLPLAATPPAQGTPAMLGGYAQDRREVLTADPACRITGTLHDPEGHPLVQHDCAGTHGTSGAPLLVPRGAGWAVAGLQIAAFTTRQGGLAVPAGELESLLGPQ